MSASYIRLTADNLAAYIRGTVSIAKVAEITDVPDELIVPIRRKAIEVGKKLTLEPEKRNHRLDRLFD